MKHPIYSTFMNEVERSISDLSKDELKQIILNLATKQIISARNDFLLYCKEKRTEPIDSDEIDVPEITAEELLGEIDDFIGRIENGEFYDEEESSLAYEREEHFYWRRNRNYDEYYDEDIDYSNEEYVLKAIELLDHAEDFYWRQDFSAAFKAYEKLFNIFNHPRYYDYDEYFIYGFSFKEALGSSFLKEHETFYLRSRYLKCMGKNDFSAVYHSLSENKDILLTDLIEIDHNPLPDFNLFINGFIEYLTREPKYDAHLIDVLFIKGGMDEVKKFAYTHGENHPSVFLYYYETIKEDSPDKDDQLKLILDGLKIIPEKYQIRTIISLDLIEIAKELHDIEHLLLGYSTAFYSNPSLKNFVFYSDFILAENMIQEIDRLKKYLDKKNAKNKDDSYSFSFANDSLLDVFSLKSAEIDTKTLIVGKYLFTEIDSLVDFINPKNYLGFSSENKYVAIITAYSLKSMARGTPVKIVDHLLDYYCFDTNSDEYPVLVNMVAARSKQIKLSEELQENILKKVEKLAQKVQEFSRGKASGEGRSEERRVGKECRSRWSPYH